MSQKESVLQAQLDDAKARLVRARAEFVGQMQQLENAKLAAENASREKARFLANMSHEIRTPINAIIGAAGLLAETAIDDEQQELVDIIGNSSDHLLTLINDILDLSKIEAGQMVLESQQFSLVRCVEESFDLVSVRAEAKAQELDVFYTRSVPRVVQGDIGRLRQVLVNLLGNSVKFTPEGGRIVLRIDASERRKGEHEIHFEILDDGPGFPDHVAGKLFHAFEQLESEHGKSVEGTGLGLAISANLVAAMDGAISARNRVGGGAKVEFSIVAEGHGCAQIESEGDQVDLGGKRAVVVDDSEITQALIEANLEAWRMHCETYGSIAATLARSETLPAPDVFILDHRLPDGTGVELATQLLERHAGVPVLFVSNYGEVRKAAAAAGVPYAAMLGKPIKMARLRNALAHALNVPGAERRASQRVPDAELAKRFPLRILLVEDNTLNQRVAMLMMARFGYGISVAANGLEAVQAVQKSHFDLILMDLHMPEMDGYEATAAIRKMTADRRPPWIVALTADATADSVLKVREFGFDDFLSKPVDQSALVKCLMRNHAELVRIHEQNAAAIPHEG